MCFTKSRKIKDKILGDKFQVHFLVFPELSESLKYYKVGSFGNRVRKLTRILLEDTWWLNGPIVNKYRVLRQVGLRERTRRYQERISCKVDYNLSNKFTRKRWTSTSVAGTDWTKIQRTRRELWTVYYPRVIYKRQTLFERPFNL